MHLERTITKNLPVTTVSTQILNKLSTNDEKHISESKNPGNKNGCRKMNCVWGPQSCGRPLCCIVAIELSQRYHVLKSRAMKE